MVQLREEPGGVFSFPAQDGVIAALREEGYFLAPLASGKARYTFAGDVRLARRATILAGRELVSVGAYSYSHSALRRGTTVGAYTSIARGVRVLGRAHPMERFTTSSITYDRKFPIYADALREGSFEPVRNPHEFLPPVIGDDVWIGAEAVLGSGVTLGTGSVIASRAVVTRDVPPYAVVGGVPARPIRQRFDDGTIERLLASEWWRYDVASLAVRADADIDTFLGALGEGIANGTAERLPAPPLFRDVVEGVTVAPDPKPARSALTGRMRPVVSAVARRVRRIAR